MKFSKRIKFVIPLTVTVSIIIQLIPISSASVSSDYPRLSVQSNNSSSAQIFASESMWWSNALNMSAEDFRNLSSVARTHLNEKWSRYITNSNYEISYTSKQIKWLNEDFPGTQIIYAYSMFTWPPPTDTFIFMKGKTYVMPDEFNEFASDANLNVSDEASALEIANLYVQGCENGSRDRPVILLSSANDIQRFNWEIVFRIL